MILNYKTLPDMKRAYAAALEAVDDLKKFTVLWWPLVEPGIEFVDGWVVDALCEHLMAVSRGQIRQIVINMPPRHIKSTLVSVIWPVWEWLSAPHIKWLYASYSASLSLRDSVKSRLLMENPLFVKFYGDRFKLVTRLQERYTNDHAGYRISSSVGGGNTGEGGDRIVCFTADTKIKAAWDEIEIGTIVEEKIPIDVWSWNFKKRRPELKNVYDYFKMETNTLIVFTLENSDMIKATPNHLIWSTIAGWIKAEDFTTLHRLHQHDGHSVKITKIERKELEKPINVYNISVKDNNNYFANGVLVKNCDDAHNNTEAESEAIRTATTRWWLETMPTRFIDPKTTAKVIVGQRVNALDISRVALDLGYDHLCLPLEYETPNADKGETKKITSIGWSDPRTVEGQILWPERFDKPIIDELKKSLGSYGTAGQLQQRPAPRGGGIIKEHWYQYYKLQRDVNGRLLNKFEYIVQSWDTAFKDKQENDFNVCQTWGIYNFGYYLIHMWQRKAEFPELLKQLVVLANIFMPNEILIEDKASGQSLIQMARQRTRIPIMPIPTDRDKIARAHSTTPIIEAKLVFLPEGEVWIPDFLTEVTTFPSAPHDDIVDSQTQALLRLSKVVPLIKSPINVSLGR
jgi:predicted phage terminase large subunit-like protein